MSDIEKLENFKTITILYGNTFVMHTEQLKEIQESIGNVLADLYEANNRINDLLDLDTQKDKLIDEIILYIIRHNYFDITEFNKNIVPTIENIKKYFEERCNNAKD